MIKIVFLPNKADFSFFHMIMSYGMFMIFRFLYISIKEKGVSQLYITTGIL